MKSDGTISVTGLSKRYGASLAVDGVSFACDPGTVTAFLGPNGSGKSTTLRLMTGLTHPDSGWCTFGGRTMLELDRAGSSVGVLLDAGAHHNGRSAVETITLAALLVGHGAERARECLDLVGLGSAAKKRVGSLSLGMRQRLGLAIALVGHPRFLVLDEPANGLDPEGISWMADLLREFAARGGTVLLSSHHLDDVEAIADHIVILDQGRVVCDFECGDASRVDQTIFSTTDDDAFAARLASHGIPCRRAGGDSFIAGASAEQIGRWSVEWGLSLIHLRAEAARPGDLRDLFLSSTTGEFVGGQMSHVPGRAAS